jgi:non-ribosomal peptide synthetase component F
VGSNPGGPGQAALRYAEDDARRVSDLLHSLGGYDEQRVERLMQPTASSLHAALARIHKQIEPLAQSAVQTRWLSGGPSSAAPEQASIPAGPSAR